MTTCLQPLMTGFGHACMRGNADFMQTQKILIVLPFVRAKLSPKNTIMRYFILFSFALSCFGQKLLLND